MSLDLLTDAEKEMSPHRLRSALGKEREKLTKLLPPLMELMALADCHGDDSPMDGVERLRACVKSLKTMMIFRDSDMDDNKEAQAAMDALKAVGEHPYQQTRKPKV